VHFRNVILRKPREDYTEVFPDEGDNDMFEVMKLLVQNNYKRTIMPEHPRGLDADKALPKDWGGYVGWTYDVAHCKAMLQIALRQVRGI
jgi:mannonate dehydratase